MKKFNIVAAILSASILASGCGVFKTQSEVKEMFDEQLYDKVSAVYPKPQTITDIASALKGAGVDEPYTEYGDSFVQTDGEIEFDVLDDSDHVVHLLFDGKNSKISYTIREEDKEAIDTIAKEMVGPDVSYTITKEKDNRTLVHMQGADYEWKDGTLEKIQ